MEPDPPSHAYTHLKRAHAKRLRELYRSAGWPYQDVIEIELLAAGLLQRVPDANGVDCMHVTDAGLHYLASAAHTNRSTLSSHDALIDQVAQHLAHDGRIVWKGLSLRALLPPDDANPSRWRMCMPDLFSVRNTTVAAYLEPIVHEIKVSRADLLSDLKNADKRNAYLDLGGQCWYVLGCNAKGAPIGQAEEIPDHCGVMVYANQRLDVVRGAPKRAVPNLPFAVWMALAKATPYTPAAASEAAPELLPVAPAATIARPKAPARAKTHPGHSGAMAMASEWPTH